MPRRAKYTCYVDGVCKRGWQPIAVYAKLLVYSSDMCASGLPSATTGDRGRRFMARGLALIP